MEDLSFNFDKIWKLKVPPRVRSFLWMISIDKLPTKEFLSKRGLHVNNLERSCPWCNGDSEKVEHLFLGCNFIKGFWRRIFEWWDIKWYLVEGFFNFFSLCNNVYLSGIVKSLWLISVAAACWSTWLARNKLVFDHKSTSMNDLVFQSKLRALLWVRAVNEDFRVEERLWWICPSRCWNEAIRTGISGRLWHPLRKGRVKFYLCGVVNEEDDGIGRVFRDEDGVARAVFTGLMAAKDSRAAD
ncbi:hypothetical protein J1N35_003874 [Gossypium stocksii]|uniref:Reverse transcriptase zinc-binding domain-containing protein n=1 Tax=Gossypium stocksii TaxID=47602 RepID=A0A9D3WAE1_9ROSI|nr:hypothetical protein J1N35_003874 [Gossypium stocksii]